MGTSTAPKNFKLYMVVYKLKRNIFPFGKTFKCQIDFEIKTQETNPISSYLKFTGFKPFGKNSLNSSKFFLDIILNTVNLD
jgi:hypothetical protein